LASDTVGTTSSTLVYNALGQMIKYTFGSTSTVLVYDEAGAAQRPVHDRFEAGSRLVAVSHDSPQSVRRLPDGPECTSGSDEFEGQNSMIDKQLDHFLAKKS
jgi:hypothetical protein